MTMTCEKRYEMLLDKYLDGEISRDERAELFEHMETCEDCTARYYELKKAVMLVQSSSHITAPDTFTESVMNNLPNQKKRVSWKKWSRKHPFVVAASLFILLMASSLFSVWNEQAGGDISVQGSRDVTINEEAATVTVPEGETIEGDLMVRNAKVEVEGEITGNLTVINGEQYLASAGEVAGDIEEVDQALEWVWYHTKQIVGDVFPSGRDNGE
ncbi:anti-sigma factor family protein [Salibacterium halotolerans]|uniref:Anti-sigma-W factor RsiW n=1 Tax=Salibacterium halotolerans TaxID=1884432 RepID=A0A1I5XQC3_9BACI|nr:anti-sigma factor [Salibacterium halotolerans]SFQ34162.1 Transmembrane transcriptional regulator (anti-sigma factor RsiW) [Salibacterium halotolerans]